MLKRILAIKLMVLAVCVLGLSGAQAAVTVFDATSPGTGKNLSPYASAGTAAVSSPATVSGFTFTWTANGNQAKQLNGSTVTLTLTAASGYNLSGLTATFTIGSFNGDLTGITVGGAGSGWTTSSASFNGTGYGTTTYAGTLNAGSTTTLIYTLSGAAGGNSGGGGLTFSSFNITATAVPEPINYALAVFGVCAVGIGTARRLIKKAHA